MESKQGSSNAATHVHGSHKAGHPNVTNHLLICAPNKPQQENPNNNNESERTIKKAQEVPPQTVCCYRTCVKFFDGQAALLGLEGRSAFSVGNQADNAQHVVFQY